MARTDDELKQIARDIHAGHVFTDRHIRPHEWQDMVSSVFFPIAMMTKEELLAQQPAMLFEYLDEAAPRTINGYPCFFSARIITEDEMPRLAEYLKRLAEAPDPLASTAP